MIELDFWFFRYLNQFQEDQYPEKAQIFKDGAITMREKAVILAQRHRNCPPLLIKQLSDLGEVEFDSKGI